MLIHKFVEEIDDYPGSVEINRTPSGNFQIVACSRGSSGGAGVIKLTKEQFVKLLDDVDTHLNGEFAAGKKQVLFGAAGTEQQQLPMRAFEMALGSPGVRDYRDVIGVSAEYHKRILGEVPMGPSAPAPQSSGIRTV